MKLSIIPKLIREANIYFSLCMAQKRSANLENWLTIYLQSLLSKVLLVGEWDKEGHMSSAENLVPYIIIIKNIKSNVPVTTKLTPVEHHKHRSLDISFEYLLPCKSFISKLVIMKYFLKVKINLSQSQKISKSWREKNI